MSDIIGRLISYTLDEHNIRITMDTTHFIAKELKVDATSTNITIRGTYGDSTIAHMNFNINFTREFQLPKPVKLDTIRSTIISQNTLIIEAEVVDKVYSIVYACTKIY